MIKRLRVMSYRTVFFGLSRLLLVLGLTACLYLLYVQAQAPSTSNVNLDDPNFNFSLYYTGNVRGNLEPCG